jgi:hypothetical protein
LRLVTGWLASIPWESLILLAKDGVQAIIDCESCVGILEDQWEAVPEEWLQPAVADSAKTKKGQRGVKKVTGAARYRHDSDSSDLSDLSSSEEHAIPDARMESDLTSISSSAASEMGDSPEEAVAKGTMVLQADRLLKSLQNYPLARRA